jgi:hypothetical protein
MLEIISACASWFECMVLLFEWSVKSLKNEFAKSLKRKKPQTPVPSSFFSFGRADLSPLGLFFLFLFLFPQPARLFRPLASPRLHVPAAHAGPARLSASPTAPFPFSFSRSQWQVGPGRQAFPYHLPRISCAPLHGRRPLPAGFCAPPPSKHFFMPQWCSAITLPPSLGRFLSLNPPLDSPSRLHGHWRPWPSGAASPPLPGLYKHPQGTTAPPSHTPELPAPPRRFLVSNRARCRRPWSSAASVDLRCRHLPTALSPAKASTCGEQANPYPLFVSPEPHAPSPLAGRRPSAPMDGAPRPPLKPPMWAYI